MATDALTEVSQMNQKALKESSGNQANAFVSEMKASALFQFDWGELLSAALTALALTGSCWVAASSDAADAIKMGRSVPTGGFKFIPNRPEPTLRSILVDVCNNGSKDSFKLASKNMEGLRTRSHTVCTHDIPLIFERLPPSTKGERELENFKDALDDLADNARRSAVLATETREGFSKWGKMVGELHAATEHQQGHTSAERDETKAAENVAKIEQTFAVDAVAASKENVTHVTEQLKKAEKRLDTALDKVPGPWATVAQGAVTGFTQAIPSIVAGVLPMVIAGSNPLAGLAMAAGGGAKAGAKPATKGATNCTNASTTPATTAIAAVEQRAAVAEVATDPVYAAAGELRGLVTHFYEFLGGETGTIDWAKFEEPKEGSTVDTPSGTSYLSATLNGRKKLIDVTGTAPNKKLMGVIDDLIKVTEEIATTQKTQKELSAEKVPEIKIAAWKSTVKQGKTDILVLASSAPSQASTNTPTGFGNVKIDVPKTDLSAQNAQLSSAMQGVQTAQNSVDVAQNSYDAAIKKAAETAKAMGEVEKRLKSLQEKGKTLEEIKKVLKDCIAVLVDLVIQIGKIEKFFTMLTTVIDEIVLPQARRFDRDMRKVGKYATADKFINVDDVTKQTIYVSTLQLKAYFSLLEDIAVMYMEVDKDYIRHGMDLCDQLAAGSSSKTPIAKLSQQLSDYSSDSAKAVAEMISSRQAEVLKGLKERARKAAESSEAIENTVRDRGLTIDESNKKAIEAGAKEAKLATQTLVDGEKSATALGNEDIVLEF